MQVDALREHIVDALDDGETTLQTHVGLFVRDTSFAFESTAGVRCFYVADLDVDDDEESVALEPFTRDTGQLIAEPRLSVGDLLARIDALPESVGSYQVVTARFRQLSEDRAFVEHSQTIGSFIDDELAVFGVLQWYEGYEDDWS